MISGGKVEPGGRRSNFLTTSFQVRSHCSGLGPGWSGEGGDLKGRVRRVGLGASKQLGHAFSGGGVSLGKAAVKAECEALIAHWGAIQACDRGRRGRVSGARPRARNGGRGWRGRGGDRRCGPSNAGGGMGAAHSLDPIVTSSVEGLRSPLGYARLPPTI